MQTQNPWWHPQRYAQKRDFLRQRQIIRRAVEDWFLGQGFNAIETSYLQVSPGLEPHLHPLGIECHEPNGTAFKRYLHTSPEFTMKKLLVAGEERIFQLARVWRDYEGSPQHRLEFTLLEWYRANADYLTLIEDCKGLIQAGAKALGITHARWQGVDIPLFKEWEIIPVCTAFQTKLGIDLLSTTPDPYHPDRNALARLLEGKISRIAADDSWEDLFMKAVGECIEPKLGITTPAVLIDYPLCLAALARPKPAEPKLAERFELYVNGLELANAFGELTDAKIQAERFCADQALKEKIYGQTIPVDEDFLAALRYGMPPSAGIALGFDRLVMLLTGAPDIGQVVWD